MARGNRAAGRRFVRRLRAALWAVLALAAREVLGGGCSVSSGAVVFGRYDVFANTPLDTTGSITLSCTQPAPGPVIRISAGGSSSFASRSLTRDSESLRYNLFVDAARTEVWGDGTGGSSTRSVTSPVDGQMYTLTIFGRVPPRQNVPAGSYGDSLFVTVDF